MQGENVVYYAPFLSIIFVYIMSPEGAEIACYMSRKERLIGYKNKRARPGNRRPGKKERTMTNNTYFENLERVATEYSSRLQEHEMKKEGIISTYGWESEEVKAWYEKEKEIKDENPYGQGAYKAYRAWRDTDGEELLLEDFCWEREIPEFIETLRQAGIRSFVTVNKSTALMENIHWFIAEGCKLEGACMVTKKTLRWLGETEEHLLGLRFSL